MKNKIICSLATFAITVMILPLLPFVFAAIIWGETDGECDLKTMQKERKRK